MTVKILFVDDDANILSAYQRSLRKEFAIDTALGGEQALEKIGSQGPYGVIVSDMGMPGMDGIKFLTLAKEVSPDTVRMVLTGNANLNSAVEALHHGNIFRYLVKPVPPENMSVSLNAGLRQYDLVTAERELLEKTLQGSIRVLMDILSMVNPEVFGRAQTLRQLMRSLALTLKVSQIQWKLDLSVMLAQIGLVTMPPAVLYKSQRGDSLTESELAVMRRAPEISHDLLGNIPRLESVADIILYQKKNYDGSGFPCDEVAGPSIPLGARMLRVLSDMLQLEAKGMTRSNAIGAMSRQVGWYDPTLCVYNR
jgi:response regulator RpfG family c-di-GMP phosphodiesterase